MAEITIDLFSLPEKCKTALHPLLDIDEISCTSSEISVPISQLVTEFICERPYHYGKKLFTGDLRLVLDYFTQGLFTYVFGEHPIYFSVQFSQNHCPSFAMSVYESGLPSGEEKPLKYMERIRLENKEIESVLDAVNRYYEKKTGHPDEKRYSLSQQICMAGEDVLMDQFSNLEPSQMKTIMSHVGKEYAEYFIDNELDMDLCDPEEFESAFWYAISKHLENEK